MKHLVKSRQLQSFPQLLSSKHHKSDQLESEFDNSTSFTKIPNLSEIINIKLKNQHDHEIISFISGVIKQAQALEKQLNYKQKQIQQLEFMIQSLQVAVAKRDEIISQIRQESLELKDENIELRDRINKSSFFNQSKSQSLNSKKGSILDVQSIDSPNKMDVQTSKKLKRARTKENNFDESLAQIIESEFCKELFNFENIENMNAYFKQYQELQHLLTIKNLVQSEELFVQTVQKLDFIGIVNIFDAITLTLSEHKSLFYNAVKSRRLFENALLLGEYYCKSSKLDDSLQEITKILCDCLDCDKAEIFILDSEKEELWTKNYKTDQIQSFSIQEDITGLCLQKKQTIAVHNAYNDIRFNKENDRKINYKTNNLLVSPILDKQSQACIGVIQTRNKNRNHFNPDDQIFIQKIAKIVSVHLRTQQKQDESITIQNSLRTLLEISFYLNLVQDFEQLLMQAENHLKNLFHVQKSKIFIVKDDHYMRINEKKELEKFELGIGLIGQTHERNEFMAISNAYNHPNFNKQGFKQLFTNFLVDIETSMPVYCLPYKNQNWMIILEVVNHRGLRTNKINTLDQEILLLFAKIVVAKIINIKG